jgi:hypothetical protein
MNGYLESCLGNKCPTSCCSRGYGEPINEFENSVRGRRRKELEALGINFRFQGETVWQSNCTDGTDCKILKHLGDGKDVRGLTCKIFPYRHTWLTQGDKKRPAIYLRPCPATRPGHSVSKDFTAEVLKLVGEHYFKLTGEKQEVVVTVAPQEV